MVNRVYGKELDVEQFKKPVLNDVSGHLEKIKAIVGYLAKNETPVAQNECYICGDSRQDHLCDIHGFEYVTCSNCGHVYTSQRYSDDAILRFYESNEYWAKVTYANKETCYCRRDSVALPKVQFVEKYLAQGCGTWVDVGSGIGDMISVVKEKGWDAIGLELSETSVAFAKEVFGIELLRKTLQDFSKENPQLNRRCRVVSLIGVLEHVVNPLDLLRESFRLLSDDGIVVIQVPNADSFTTMVQSVYPENVFRHMSPIEHIMVFTENSLNTALGLTGFEPLAYWYHGLDFYELLSNMMLSNPRIHGSPMYRTLISHLNALQQVMDDHELSDRIICVARKIS
jgi:2-polyprenyl-3-methyl-5-hydroxy-6-metoxy-1,4-benzoquinol methylase